MIVHVCWTHFDERLNNKLILQKQKVVYLNHLSHFTAMRYIRLLLSTFPCEHIWIFFDKFIRNPFVSKDYWASTMKHISI